MSTEYKRLNLQSHGKGSRNIIAYAISTLNKIDNFNIIKVEPNLNILSETFALNSKHILYPTSFEMVMQFHSKRNL